jgi:hypothetical protein
MIKNFLDYENIKKNVLEKLSKNIYNINSNTENDNNSSSLSQDSKTDDLEYLYYKLCKKSKIDEIVFLTVATFNSNYSSYQLQSSSIESDKAYEEIVQFFRSIVEEYTFIFRDNKSKNTFLDFFNFFGDNTLDFDCISIFNFYDADNLEFTENDFYSIFETKFQYHAGFLAPNDYEYFRIITDKDNGTLINQYTNSCAVHLCEFYKDILEKIEEKKTNDNSLSFPEQTTIEDEREHTNNNL